MPSWNSDPPVTGLVRGPKGEVTGPGAGTTRLLGIPVACPEVTVPEGGTAAAALAESDPSVLAGGLCSGAAGSPRARASVEPKSAPEGARTPTLAHSESMRLIASRMSAIGTPTAQRRQERPGLKRRAPGDRRGALSDGRRQPPVAEAGLGHDPAGIVGVVSQLAPELADVDAQVGRLVGVADPPDLLQ